MKKRIGISLALVCILAALVVAAVIAAGSHSFSGTEPTYTSPALGTGADGSAVAHDYRMLVLNTMGLEINDLVISLLNKKGDKQIPADPSNKINSVTVGGKAYPITGEKTQVKVDIDPGIASSVGSSSSSPTEILVNATTDQNFVKIHVTVSLKRLASSTDHYGYGGDCSAGPGTHRSLVVPHPQDGFMFSLTNPEGSPDAIDSVFVQFVGEDVPAIDSVSVDGCNMTVDIHEGAPNLVMYGDTILAGDSIEVWVKFEEVVEHPTAALILIMSD